MSAAQTSVPASEVARVCGLRREMKYFGEAERSQLLRQITYPQPRSPRLAHGGNPLHCARRKERVLFAQIVGGEHE